MSVKATTYLVTINVAKNLAGGAATAALGVAWKELREYTSSADFKRWISWAKFKTEVGKETKHRHIQGVCKAKCDFNTLRKLFPAHTHFEPKNSHEEEKEAISYIDSDSSEEDRYVNETFQTPKTAVYGDVPITYKGRDVLTFDKMYEWQKQLVEELEGPVNRRKIIWYVDEEGGNGKSSLLKYFVHNSSIAWSAGAGSMNDIAFASSSNIDSTRAFIVDYPRHINVEEDVNYDALEKFKDGIMSINKYKSTNRTFAPKHVVVFSNHMPCTEKMSSDRWNIRVLKNKMLMSDKILKTPSRKEKSPAKGRKRKAIDILATPRKEKISKVSDFSDLGSPLTDKHKRIVIKSETDDSSDSSGETLGSQDTDSPSGSEIEIDSDVLQSFLKEKKLK